MKNWQPTHGQLEGALRRATSHLRLAAETLERDNPADPIASLLRERVAEYKAILGDPADWRAAA